MASSRSGGHSRHGHTPHGEPPIEFARHPGTRACYHAPQPFRIGMPLVEVPATVEVAFPLRHHSKLPVPRQRTTRMRCVVCERRSSLGGRPSFETIPTSSRCAATPNSKRLQPKTTTASEPRRHPRLTCAHAARCYSGAPMAGNGAPMFRPGSMYIRARLSIRSRRVHLGAAGATLEQP